MKEGRKPEYAEKTSGDKLQKMPHTTAQRFKPQARLEPAQQHWWQLRKADMLTVTPRVGPRRRERITVRLPVPQNSWLTTGRHKPYARQRKAARDVGVDLSGPNMITHGDHDWKVNITISKANQVIATIKLILKYTGLSVPTKVRIFMIHRSNDSANKIKLK